MKRASWFLPCLRKMIDFKLCQKCPYGKWQPPRYGKDGDLEIMPSVECGLNGDILLMKSDVPENCDYALGHRLTTQGVPLEFACKLSGER